MEADWEVEIGGDAPVIDAHWTGFVDLRRNPERVGELPEAAQLPGLAYALLQLNHRHAPVWTAKCDVWPIEDPGSLDPDEFDAPRESTVHGLACYIDLLPKSDQQWLFLAKTVAEAKTICALLRMVPLPCCRADLILRRAFLTPDLEDTGITAYVTACGKTANEASQTLQAALKAFADTLLSHSTLK